MLVLNRRMGESIFISDDITLTVIEICGDKVRLGLVVPRDMPIYRKEVWDVLYGPQSRAVIDPAWLAWNDGTVVRLARAIAEQGNYDALPILADALEEAGCADADILGDCRSCSPDTRSSWVVNRVLSES